MTLTKHQILHLDAIIAENTVNKTVSLTTQIKLAIAKKVDIEKYSDYSDKIVAMAEDIKKKGIFPKGLEPSDIHDYLEKDPNWELVINK